MTCASVPVGLAAGAAAGAADSVVSVEVHPEAAIAAVNNDTIVQRKLRPFTPAPPDESERLNAGSLRRETVSGACESRELGGWRERKAMTVPKDSPDVVGSAAPKIRRPRRSHEA
jgi:hypothetical protein